MWHKLVRAIYGEITTEEIKKFSLLALTFFFIIGCYWLMRPLKDAVFVKTVGIKLQPMAKVVSVFFVMILVLIYSKLVDIFKKHNLFYVIGSFYVVLFFLLGYLVSDPVIGIANSAKGAHRWIGWLSYISIESFGSIMVALFWSFVISTTDSDSAKKGFPLVVAGGQTGGVLGPLADVYAHQIGIPNLYIAAGVCVSLVMLMIFYFMKVTPKHLVRSTIQHGQQTRTGFFEGLRLIITRPYLFGIFAIVGLYEIVGTVIDYQMKMQADMLPEYATAEGFAGFLGWFGVGTNSVALLMALLGTSYLFRRFGLVFCLLTFPMSVGVAISSLYCASVLPGISPRTLLWVTFSVMIIIKGLSYALNNPSKDMMYIPTSRDAKFKAKGWIDMFGSRGAKSAGAQISNALKENLYLLMTYGTLISLGIIGIWIMAALFVGRKFVRLTKEERIIS